MEVAGNIALVTGGGSGLGAATARHLAEKGAKVAVLDFNIEAANAVAAEIGGIAVQADVSDADAVGAAFDAAISHFGTAPRIVISCAGVGTAARIVGREGKLSIDVFEKTLKVNLFGTYNVMSHGAKHMALLEPLTDGERGVIVNTASAAAQDGQVGQASYAASKAAIVGMTLPIARDMMDEGIRINTIMPGIFGTPLLLGLPDNVKQALAASVPFPKRLGDPDEFAQAVEFLVTCGYMNAESIRVDGAIRMAPR